jgi:DnaJ like chaperone protein
MFFIFIAAFIGLLVSGPLGFLVGGLVGYAAHVILRQSILGGLRVVQSELIDSTFAIMGALCKADKVVTPDEINAVEQIFRMLHLQGDQRQQARAAFNQGKQPDFDLDAAVDRFARISRGRLPLIQLFLRRLWPLPRMAKSTLPNTRCWCASRAGSV